MASDSNDYSPMDVSNNNDSRLYGLLIEGHNIDEVIGSENAVQALSTIEKLVGDEEEQTESNNS